MSETTTTNHCETHDTAEAVLKTITTHAGKMPPIKKPDEGIPITSYDIWPGDVIVRRERILVVIGITNMDAIIYDLHHDEYNIILNDYLESYIKEDKQNYYTNLVGTDNS